jgi:hypothetical protein
MELWLEMCQTGTILDHRLALFGNFPFSYAKIDSRDGRSTIARVERWRDCSGVSREVALRLYPYYGWGIIPVRALFFVEEAQPKRARRVIMEVPFGITEALIRRQLAGYPLAEGSIAIEYLGHIEFGEVVQVEPPMSVMSDSTELTLRERPVEDDVALFEMRGEARKSEGGSG